MQGIGGCDAGPDAGPCAGEKLVPVSASMSSVGFGRDPNLCIEGNTGGLECHSGNEAAPWLALDYGSEVTVSTVVIVNRISCCGERTKNVNIRVSSTPPVSGSVTFTAGQLLGTFEGPGTNGQRIQITGERELTGRYVVVQLAGAYPLHLQEVTAWKHGETLLLKPSKVIL